MAKKVQQKQSQTESDFLNELQTRAAGMVATGISHKTTAERLGVHPTTISKWQRCPYFRAEVNRLLADARESTSRRLVHAANIALSVLIDIAANTEAAHRDRITACSRILDLVSPSPAPPAPTDGRELEEKEERERAHDAFLASLERF